MNAGKERQKRSRIIAKLFILTLFGAAMTGCHTPSTVNSTFLDADGLLVAPAMAQHEHDV